MIQQAELERTFNPVIKSTREAEESITKQLVPLREELKKTRPTGISRKRTWDEHSEDAAIDYYLNKYDKKKLDKYFGIQLDGDNLWLGDKEIQVDGNSNIIVEGVRYKGTPGLWSLIMLASLTTDSYTGEDMDNYEDLTSQTKLKDNPRGVGKDSRPKQTIKRRILEELVVSSAGSGVQFLPGDIKGLTEKLSLLLAEFRAGNRTTRNEIVYILDELLRRKKISRKEYTDINTYLAQCL